MDIVIYVLAAALAGWIGSRIMGGSAGFIASAILGLIGAYLGSWLAGKLDLPELLAVGGVDLVWAVVGVAIVLFVLSRIPRRTLSKLTR